MAYATIPTEDFVISSEAVATATWTNGVVTLNSFYTSSVQEAGSSGDYYLNIYQTSSNLSAAQVQFAATYGNKFGSGSVLYNPAVTNNSPSKTTYGQYRTLINGDENTDFSFGSGNNIYTSTEFWAINVDRNRYRESLLPGTLTLILSGSGNAAGWGANKAYLSLTDNSLVTSTITYNDAGRVFQLVSGSAGTVYTSSEANGYHPNSGSYGWFLPDIGVILLNPKALSASIGLASSASYNIDGLNYRNLFTAISGGGQFTLQSQETISADYIFIRARNAEYNYTDNPSFTNATTGDINLPIFINNPQTYITTIGMYNDAGDLLAVAKMSRPLPKDFTKEALIRVKLDF